ncbi:MAG: hypothetical protein JOZ41_15895 [Chloroflexi bacterium]|nr:hypothetical protein [Chloroflexota bacterium]
MIPRQITHEGIVLEQHVREGRFQRSLALIAAFSSLLSGLEVSYEHYRGSYSQQIMYTPVLLSFGLVVAGVSGALSRRAARTVLPLASLLTVVDGLVGFYFHVRGVARKPGGWRIPVMNTIMGPPVFAPLLFALSGYLGLIASFLRREDDPADGRGWLRPSPALPVPRARSGPGTLWVSLLPRGVADEGISLEQHIREGRFQKHVAVAAGLAALFSGLEALYSHYKNRFAYRRLQWSPIVLTPLMLVAGIGTVPSRRVARTVLPIASGMALLDGTLGFYFHARGVLRRPGGLRLPVYNVIYGPPVFAPLLFAASGFMGILASLLRRADR